MDLWALHTRELGEFVLASNDYRVRTYLKKKERKIKDPSPLRGELRGSKIKHRDTDSCVEKKGNREGWSSVFIFPFEIWSHVSQAGLKLEV